MMQNDLNFGSSNQRWFLTEPHIAKPTSPEDIPDYLKPLYNALRNHQNRVLSMQRNTTPEERTALMGNQQAQTIPEGVLTIKEEE